MTELEKQIDAAYDFRGHVTIKLKGGKAVEGFIFNRQFADPALKRAPFVEVILKGSGDKAEFEIASLESVELTGENCAAGKSYEDYMKKKAAENQPKA